jgi:hypothetical protein
VSFFQRTTRRRCLEFLNLGPTLLLCQKLLTQLQKKSGTTGMGISNRDS